MKTYRVSVDCEICGVKVTPDEREEVIVGIQEYDLCPACRRSLRFHIDDLIDEHLAEEDI